MKLLSKFYLTAILPLLLSGCGNEKDAPLLQGVWMVYHDGWMEALYVYDDYCAYGEESMDGLEFSADFTRKVDSGYDIMVEEKYPGKLMYDSDTETLTLNVPGVMQGKDFKVNFKRSDYFGAMAPVAEEVNVDVYSNPDLDEVMTEATPGQAFPILSLNDRWVTLRVPVDATGYVGPTQFSFVKEYPSDKFLDENFQAYTSEGLTSYAFKKKGEEIAIIRNLIPTDACRGFDSYYGATIKGNAITVDRRLNGFDAFENVDMSSAEPLDSLFTIYVADQPYIVQLYIDGLRYNPL